MAEGPTITATIKGDVPTTTIRLTFDLVGIAQDSAFAQTVLGELTSVVHSLAPDTLDRFGISASTERHLNEYERDFTGHLALSEPDHITSVTMALGSTLCLDVRGGTADHPDTVAMTLKAEGGTAIGVPTVAVDQLRAAGLVL